MIKLSNGHCLEFVAASGSLAFDGRGWPWEWPLRWVGLLDPRLFTIVVKTVLLQPKKGNLQWHAPWRVVKLISENGETINPVLAFLRPSMIDGAINAVGLTNAGLEHWLKKDYPVIENHGYNVIVSITGEEGRGCVEMARRLNEFRNVVGIEFNASCPNTDPSLLEKSDMVVGVCHDIKQVCRHPLLLKLSYTQPYIQIAKETESIVEAISINSVPWNTVFPDKESPLARYGGGGVSGRVAQPFTWQMVKGLARETNIPVIGASIWEYEDIERLRTLGAEAFHFGTVFMPYPWRPSIYVRKWKRGENK